MIKSNKVFTEVISQINSENFLVENRVNERDFTRNRKLNFPTLVIAFINRLTKSLTVELNKFFLQFKDGQMVSKQAFSTARYKLKPEAFIELNETFVKSYYQDNTHSLYADKYLLLGIDGSNYELPWFEDIVAEFGFVDNKLNSHPRAMATGIKLWDLLNEIAVSSKISRYKASETAMLDELWQPTTDLLNTCQNAPIIIVGDAYYPGLARFIELTEKSIHFLIRCKPTFCREVVDFMSSGLKQQILHIDLHSDHRRRWRLKGKGILEPPAELVVRAVRIEKTDGTSGCLLCSVLSENDLSIEQVKEIYFFRYGIEVSFYFEKFKTEVEDFATKKAMGIYQEWYANILSINMTQLLIEQAQKELDEKQKYTSNKHIYKINKSVAIGMVKDEIPKVLFGQESMHEFIPRMVKIIGEFREPVRPQRVLPRKRKHKVKYHMNQRRIT
ncbi:MAG: hypothetical protein ACJAYJ_001791 [Saprospiraceae bacterium]|jgi:hypothetical protein